MRKTVFLTATLASICGALLACGGGQVRHDAQSAPLVSDREPVCHVRFEKFRKSVSWYNGQNRLLIEADSACEHKLGNLLELENVTLTLFSKDTLLAKIRTPDASYSIKNDELLIGKNEDVLKAHSCLKSSELLDIRLRLGELRTPGMKTMLNSVKTLSCLDFKGHKI